MSQTSQELLRKPERSSSLKKYVEPSNERHAFMTEVARIAVYRGFSQEDLAEAYGEATKSRRRPGSELNGGNVYGHFNPTTNRAPRPNVLEGYAKALGMSENYVNLLVGSDMLLERNLRRANLSTEPESLIGFYLSPMIAEPLFEREALWSACSALARNKPLRDRCFREAELAVERSRTMPGSAWVPELPFESAMLEAVGAQECAIKWTAIAPLLLTEVDLISNVTHKSSDRIRQEEILLRIWQELFDYVEIGWDEWLAIEHVLKVFLARRRLPLNRLVERLHSDGVFQIFKSEKHQYEPPPDGVTDYELERMSKGW